jgi:hypothetical protein
VDFAALVKTIATIPKKQKAEPGDKFQVAVRNKGQASVTTFSLEETSFLEQLLGDLESKWKADLDGARFDRLCNSRKR